MGTFQKNAEVQVVSVCDVYGARVERAKSRAAGAAGFTDHRKLLEAEDLDAVLDRHAGPLARRYRHRRAATPARTFTSRSR